jgi:hypothetical protein
LADRVFPTLPEAHQQKVQREREAAKRATRKAALSVGLFKLERPLDDHEREVRAFKQRAMEPLDAETAWLQNTGQVGLTAEHTALLLIGDELMTARFERESTRWKPAEALARYKRAREQYPAERSRAFMAFVEGRYGSGDGWHDRAAELTEDDIQAAAALSREIASVRQERIPQQIAEIEQEIEELNRLAGKVRRLDKILPINPDQDFEAAATFQSELADETATAQV